MGGIVEVDEKIENAFMSLPSEDKTAVISHGAAIRFSELSKRHFLGACRTLRASYKIEAS